MSMILLENISNICLGLGLGLLVIAVFLFIKLDIYKAWHILTGKPMREKNRRGKRTEQRDITDRTGNKTKSGAMRTTRATMQDSQTVLLGSESTVALTQKLSRPIFEKEDFEKTFQLKSEELPNSEKTAVLETEKGAFHIIYEITYIHANV